MKRALRVVLILGLPIFLLQLLSIEVKGQCPVVIDSIISTDVTCNGAEDGEFCIYVSGGSPNYIYQYFNGVLVNSSGPQASANYCFTGLGSGPTNYQIIVVGEDGAGGSCTVVSGTATINEPPPFDITVSVVDETCPSSNDGEASVLVTGGIPPYTYSWLPFLETNDTITGLDGGSYSVEISDISGCSQTEPYTIGTTPDWAGTLTGTDPTCFGGNNGVINSNGISGGAPPYSFSWTGTGQTTENISGLTAGSYTLTVTDSEGCSFVLPTVDLTTPPPILITETHVDATCDGQGNGSIDVSVSGGVGPYTYLWSNGASTQNLTGLLSGNYILTVTDAIGCNQNMAVTIVDETDIILSAVTVSSGCAEANGSIDLTVVGGSGNFAYVWQPGGAITEDVTGLAAGIYQVMVTDNTLGCIDSLTVIISDIPGHEVTGIVTDNSNCISSNGSIDVSVTGGSGDFDYQWTHGPTTEDVSGLFEGAYYVIVTDNVMGCVSIGSFVVQSGNDVLLSSSVTEPTCGQINGAIDITVSGGTGPYTFSWSSGASTEDISGIGSGIYSVNIVDNNGCPFDTTFTLSDQSSMTVTPTVVEPTCFGYNDGSIALVVAGGTGPFTYVWSNGESTASINDLWAATYTVTVADQGTGCMANESYTLTNPSGFSGSVNLQNETCAGTMDGSIDLSISGGTPPYNYLWNPGAITTEDLTNIGADTYTVVLTDTNGCSFNGAYTITASPAVSLSETHQDISCNGENDGSIDITVLDGTPAFNYLWEPNNETTEDLSNLGPGSYEVFVTDAAGCSDSLEVEILEPDVLVLNTSSTDASCNDTCDGSASITPTGGSAPYTYTWSPNVSSGANATSLCAGNYSVIVSDANGCSDTALFLIDDNQIQTVFSSTEISCNGTCDGSATVAATGNNPPFTYDWQPSGGNDTTAINLCAGNYTLTVTDNTGCEVDETFAITEPDAIGITMAVTDVTCEGGSDGAIDLTVTGGVAPYTYQWFPNGQTTEDLTDLPADNYWVLVTDANGCTSSTITLGGAFNGGTLALPDGTGASYSTSINITGMQPGATLTDIQDFEGVCLNMEHTWLSDLDIELTCPNGQNVLLEGFFSTGQTGAWFFLGDANDNDDVTPVPGVGFVYCWDNNPIFGTMEAEAGLGNTVPVSQGVALPAGSYTSVDPLSNLIGCPLNGDWTVTITDNFAIDNGFIFDWGVSFSGSAGNDSLATVNEPDPITITSTVDDATCGACDGSITVTPTSGVAPFTFLWNTGATTATASSLCAGVYNVLVTDANGCTDNFFIPVDHTDGPTGSNTTVVDASCFGACDGEGTVSGIGGTPPYNYQWVSGGYSTPNVTGLCAGTYSVQIQDSLGCIFTEEVIIGEPDEILIGQTVLNSACNLCTGEIELSPISGVAPFTYDWSPSVSADSTATGLCAGVYNITVTDATGCTEVVTSLVSDLPAMTLTMSGTSMMCSDSCNGEAIATPSGGTPPYTYLWDDLNNQTDSIASGLCAGLYSVTVTDGNGCSTVNQITITEQDPIGLSLLNLDNEACFGSCEGSITVIPSSPSIPFTYLWDDGLAQTTATADNLCAGTYTVVVTDANGCAETASGTLIDPIAITGTTTGFDASCNGVCDGWTYVTPVAGTPPYTYLWDDPITQTSDTVVGLCSGSYMVTVTDVNNCEITLPVTIDEPDSLEITISGVVNLDCDGECIGEATTNASGGTGPYSYQWDDALAQTTATADSLCAGDYTVTVTDANGCTAQEVVTVSGPIALTSSIIAQTGTSCNGGCEGSAVVEANGGTPPYSYQWNDQSNTTNDTITDLCMGIYNVTVTDANGCESVSSVVIAEPDVLDVSATADSTTCYAECNGTATASVQGGTSPYAYQWNDPNNQTTPIAEELCAGTYQVIITDANGCSDSVSVTINEPTALDAGVSVVDASCSGSCDGSASVNPTNGIAPYQILWLPGMETTATITDLCAGEYTVVIIDANGCADSTTINISEPPAIIISTNTVEASCSGICDGEAFANATGGVGGFTYLWNDPASTASDTVTDLCAGTYTVFAQDTDGCVDSVEVIIDQPDSITITITPQSVTCNLDCDGAAIVVATGGNTPYTYQWNDPSNTANDTVTDLCAGIYGVVITDSLGCTGIGSTVIAEPLPLLLIDSVVNVTCGGTCDGTAGVFVQGGTSGYSYQWDDSDNQTTPFATGLCAGSYQVVVTDANGCMDSVSVTITEPPVLEIPVMINNDPTCSEVCDGSLTVNPSSGTPPYTVLWLPGSLTTETANGLCAGEYSVIVVDAAGCADTATAILTDPQVLEAQITATTQVLCYGDCSGEATVTATGGTQPYAYTWNDPSNQTTETAIDLCVDIYGVTVTDAEGCTASATVLITDSAALVAYAIPFGVSCNGDDDGSATVFASGGIGPYFYSWNDNADQDTQTATGLEAGAYVVTVFDSQSPACTTQANVIIEEPDELAATAVADSLECGNVCDGSVIAVPVGGTSPYQFSWNDPSNQIGIEAINLCVDTYTVTITDANGCTTQANANVNGPPAIVSTATPTMASCSNVADGAIDLTVTGGIPGYTYLWSPNNGTTQDLSNIEFGTYTVNITDTTGCSIIATYGVAALVNIDANAGIDDTICVGNSILLDGSGGGDYLWTPSATLSDSAVADPIAAPNDTTTYFLTVTIDNCVDVDTVTIYTYAIPPVDAGDSLIVATDGEIELNASGLAGWDYSWEPAEFLDNPSITDPLASPIESTTFYVRVVDQNGCVSSDSVYVEVIPSIEFPDGITPNGDGMNDTWIIGNIDLFDDAIVEVYSRWGELLFQSDPGYPEPWDGTFNGKELPVGTYYYVIHSSHFEEAFTGPITLVR